ETLPTWLVSIGASPGVGASPGDGGQVLGDGEMRFSPTPNTQHPTPGEAPAPNTQHPTPASAASLALLLRQAPNPVIARVERGKLLLDPRTVLEGEEGILLEVVIKVCSSYVKRDE